MSVRPWLALAAALVAASPASVAPAVAPRKAARSAAVGAVPAISRAKADARPIGRTVTLARLEIRVATSSEWTTLRFDPGRIVAGRLLNVDPGLSIRSLDSSGWVIRGVAGSSRSLTITAVFEEPSGAPTIGISLKRDVTGSAVVDVTNLSRRAFRVAHIVSERHDPAEPSPTLGVAIPRAGVFGNLAPLMIKADPRRLVLAAYHPWFGRNSYGDPRLSDQPLSRTGVWNGDDVDAMVREARAAGIDGFAVSWRGTERNGLAFDLVLRAMEARNGVAVPYLSVVGANAANDENAPSDPATVERWLGEALGRAGSKAFLRSRGVPVVFVYEMRSLTPAQWSAILESLAGRGRPVLLVGDAPLSEYDAVSWGVHTYNPNFLSASALEQRYRAAALDARLLAADRRYPRRLFAATVSPGYDDRSLRGAGRPVVERGAQGERYAQTWSAAFASDPDWILITSWNEWYEATSVQPSVRFGDRALRQTADQSARFKQHLL